ncbi:LTXXQ motif family protein (fragment) [Burkholderiales bacterium 8X]
MIKSRHHLLLAGLMATAFASSAFAQAAPQGPLTAPVPPAAEAQVGAPNAQAAKPNHHGRADRAARFERMKAHRAQRMAALKDKLKLTPQQESAWSSFASANQPPARPDGANLRGHRAEMAKLSTPERLERMQARQAERSARFTKRIEATRTFYAALTPEQQKTFDAESVMRFGPGHRHGRHHGMEHRADAPMKG